MTGWVHEYVSTACLHALNEPRPELHSACRNDCKYGDAPEPCRCPCHGEAGTQPGRTSQVDQARDIARELYNQAWRFGNVSEELEQRVATDPALFWLRGEEREPDTWTPPEETS